MTTVETRQSADEFYIGYEEQMPSGIARRVVCGVGLFAVAAAVAVVVALAAQQRLPASTFEYGVVREVSGVLRRDPYPWLDVAGRRVWLAGPGKFGADRVVGDRPDGPVTLAGSAIRRGKIHMLELLWLSASTVQAQSKHSASTVQAQSMHRASTEHAQSKVRVYGEIVDSKCFFGVMNPGEGTVHRDCARRCLSGGMTPMLLVRDGRGREELVVLVSATGDAIGRQLAPLAGRPVTVSGHLTRDGDQYVLYADADAYRPADPTQ